MSNYRCHSANYTRQGNRRLDMGQMPATRTNTASGSCHQNNSACNSPGEMRLAMAYVPWQDWECIYEAEKGFPRGTIFEKLDMPFRGTGGCQNAR